MARWRCNCIFCRTFVHPVLRRVGGLSEPRIEHPPEAEERSQSERPVQAAPVASELAEESATGQAPLPAATPVISQEVIEGVVGKVVENVRTAIEESGKILVERLDRIEENMGKLRKEIQSLVSSMENVIVEFREAISELTNPLVPSASAVTREASNVSGIPPSGSLSASSVGSHLPSFVKPIMQLLDKVDESLLIEIINEYERSKVISSDEARKLKTIISTIARLKKKGVDDETIVAMVSSILFREVRS